MIKYEIIVTSVLNFSRRHSQAWVLGCVYGLVNWRVISQETYLKLVLSVVDYYHKKPLSSYDSTGNQI